MKRDLKRSTIPPIFNRALIGPLFQSCKTWEIFANTLLAAPHEAKKIKTKKTLWEESEERVREAPRHDDVAWQPSGQWRRFDGFKPVARGEEQGGKGCGRRIEAAAELGHWAGYSSGHRLCG